jgi:hypothetical protein
MRYTWTIAASTFILWNYLVDAIATPTDADIKTLRTRRIANVVDSATFTPEDLSNLYVPRNIQP